MGSTWELSNLKMGTRNHCEETGKNDGEIIEKRGEKWDLNLNGVLSCGGWEMDFAGSWDWGLGLAGLRIFAPFLYTHMHG